MPDFNALLTRASKNPRTIVLAEGEDVRVLSAACAAAKNGTAKPVLLGDIEKITALAEHEQIELNGLELINPQTSKLRAELQSQLFEARKHKGMTQDTAATEILDNLHFANMMVRQGHADGCVAGAVYPTADVVRTAMQLIGKHPNSKFVCSFFIMLMTQPFHPIKDIAIFADCALMIDPDENQLAEIAIATGESALQLLGMQPRIALLSFSTAASARHASVSKVSKATQIAKQRKPDWHIVGEVQLDAAVIPEILQAKSPKDADGAPMNTLIFPNLDAGNIGYKMCERFGAAEAIGPVLQGLAKPVNDLSRGCKTEDIENIIAVTSAQASASLSDAEVTD